VITISCFTYELYRRLTGEVQDPKATSRDVIETIVARWDASKVMAPETVRLTTQIAVCQIGMRWHPTDRYSFGFDVIAKMLAEISPELQGKEVTAATMRDILASHHLQARRH
jgi:hypothetical protein